MIFKILKGYQWITLLILLIFYKNSHAQDISLSDAIILISPDIPSPVKETCIKVLQEEIEKKTSLKLVQKDKWEPGKTTIALCLENSKELLGKAIPQSKNGFLTATDPEGFRLLYRQEGNKRTVWIIGADKRGVLFGIGVLLRKARMSKRKISLALPLDLASAPAYPIRGHQIGYRNLANSYDAWSVAQYEQYIRELAIFGTNAIENIPLGGKGDESVHMDISRKKMNTEISKICEAYDMDYWVWIPATIDLSDKELREKELQKHKDFYRDTPRLNDVFIPGGDPGHNHPREVMPFLRDLHAQLTKYHPDAGIWISLQGFSEEQIDYFYQYLEGRKPSWLRGVVSGPSSPPLAGTRFRLPKQYKHRHYPDITHNVRCDYPALNFDQAFALTIGREGINPQPEYYAKIHGDYAWFTDGFVSYSDGCHDDVNKIIWSQRGWNPEKSVRDIMLEYCRFFFNSQGARAMADGILALEKNWDGPLTANGGVETTFSYWNNLEKNHPELSKNWRWLLLTMRANYDTYIRRRLIHEKGLEKQANEILAQVDELGTEVAMKRSLEKISEAVSKPIDQDILKKIKIHAEDLFKLIGLQTSVELYQASSPQRGCILDFVDHPLNNRWWYEDEFKKIKQMDTDEEKKQRLEVIRTWENPGRGSYYDDISNISNSPHVITTVYDAVDFGWWNDGKSRWRLSSQVYQNDPVLEYANLDPNGRYIIRVTGDGDALLRIDGQRMEPVKYDKGLEEFKEFVVPRSLAGDGKITVSFDRPEESHLNWRNYSRISDVWLIKK